MPDQFDIDAVIALERALRDSQGPVEPQERVAKLVEILRETDIHVTSVNAVSLDAEEQELMDRLLGIYNAINEWYRGTNGEELTTAVHAIQGFIVQHMLHRLNPGQWADWSREQPFPVTLP